MPRGESILRESGKPERTLHKIILRHASPEDLAEAQHTTFEADGHTYRVETFKIDTLHRLIAIGKLVD
jgi:hypothetical protein